MPKYLAYLGLAMSIFFIFMSIGIIVRPPQFFAGMSDSARYVAGFLIMAYGIFRFSRAVKTIRS